MAKHVKKWDGDVLTYEIPGHGVATLDISTLSPDIIKKAVQFAFPTLARNATAGLMADADKPTAFKRVQERFKNFIDGVWRAGGGAESAERPTSMLARAMAEVLGIEPADAAARIAALIDSNVDKASLSPDEEDDKEAIRKVAAAVRKAIADTAEIVPVLARIKAEEAVKRAEAAKAPAKEGTVSLADLIAKR